MCVSTRADHALRNIPLPPEDVRPCAEGRDRAMCAMLHACLGKQTSRIHGLGRCSNACDAGRAGGLAWPALRTAPAACCGAWGGHAGILARTATTHGVGMCTSTDCEARAGRNAPLGQHSSAPHAQPRVPGTGPGNWPHNWQFHASRTRSLYFFTIECHRPLWSRLTRHCPSRVHKPPGSRP